MRAMCAIIGSVAKWFFGRSLATGFLTGLRKLLCSVAERWPVQPTSTPAPSLLSEAGGRQAAVSLGRTLSASLVASFLVPGLVSGVVSSVVATLAPLRDAPNLGGHFRLCSLLTVLS